MTVVSLAFYMVAMNSASSTNPLRFVSNAERTLSKSIRERDSSGTSLLIASPSSFLVITPSWSTSACLKATAGEIPSFKKALSSFLTHFEAFSSASLALEGCCTYCAGCGFFSGLD
jgi:hypothetical protein